MNKPTTLSLFPKLINASETIKSSSQKANVRFLSFNSFHHRNADWKEITRSRSSSMLKRIRYRFVTERDEVYMRWWMDLWNMMGVLENIVVYTLRGNETIDSWTKIELPHNYRTTWAYRNYFSKVFIGADLQLKRCIPINKYILYSQNIKLYAYIIINILPWRSRVSECYILKSYVVYIRNTKCNKSFYVICTQTFLYANIN